MTSKVIYWILILAFQFLVLNHLDISSYLVPQVFIILLITLPLHLGKNTVIGIAFALGLLADFFVSTPGIHASGCLWLVVLRMYFIDRQDVKQQVANKLPYEISSVGLLPFIYTASILSLFYHMYVLWLQNMGALWWANFIPAVLASTVLALTLISIVEYISLNRK